jgi:hypothetical protein
VAAATLQSSNMRLLRLLCHMVAAFPANGAQPFREDWVRVVVAGIQVICVHAREVLDLELDQCRGKLRLVAQFQGEVVCL